MLRTLAALLPALAMVACVEQPPLTPEEADADGQARLVIYQMAQLDVLRSGENCGNGIDDDRDGAIDLRDPDCGAGFFDDMMEGTQIHPGATGTLRLWDGDVRYRYTGATATSGGSLRLERALYNARGGFVGTAVTTVRLGRGDITVLAPALSSDRLTGTSTSLSVGTSGGQAWLVDDGFTNDEIYED